MKLGINPNRTSFYELGNSPKLAEGKRIKLYGGGFIANAEYITWTCNYEDNLDFTICTML